MLTLKGLKVWELNLDCKVSSWHYLFLELKKTPKPPPELSGQLALPSSIPVEKVVSRLLHPRSVRMPDSTFPSLFRISLAHRWRERLRERGVFSPRRRQLWGDLTAACLPRGGHCEKPASPRAEGAKSRQGKTLPERQEAIAQHWQGR